MRVGQRENEDGRATVGEREREGGRGRGRWKGREGEGEGIEELTMKEKFGKK